MGKKKSEITIRSSAAEYLTYIASVGDDERVFEVRYQDENIWLTQKMMSLLYDVSVAAISQHIKRIYDDGELAPEATIKKYLTVQNKLHYAVHRHTAAELIVERADATKEHMGLTTWENAPDGKIVKADVSIAKNYLNDEEMKYLERIVSLYLDYAELQAERKIPMSMEDWAKRLDGFLEFNGNELLIGPGKISAEQAKLYAESEYEKYRIVQDALYESDFDKFLLEEKTLPETTIERVEAKNAFYQLREQATDVPQMSLDEINAEISDVRAERKRDG